MKKSVTEQIVELISKFDGQFLKPEILDKGLISQIENEYHECRFAPQGEEYLEDGETITDTIEGNLCRMSAPGYLDWTEWELCRDEDDILDWISREAEEIQEVE